MAASLGGGDTSDKSDKRAADTPDKVAFVACVPIVTCHQPDEPGCNQDPPLPPPGTPERAALDQRQADTLAGLLKCALPERQPRRLQSWRDAADRAVPGDRCSCCGGREWWLLPSGAGGCLRCQPRPAGAGNIVT
jgi:hypothetical protein